MPEKMNPEIKAEWVARLRDPETKQTKGTLNRVTEDLDPYTGIVPVGNCCLGVLCEIAAEKGVIERERDEEGGVIGYVDKYEDEDGVVHRDIETGVLPSVVREWAGLSSFNPNVRDAGGRPRRLANLNDAGTTFPVLADLIDAQL